MSTSLSDETDRVRRHTPSEIKAELSSLSAQTKLMPFGYNKRIDAETDIILQRYTCRAGARRCLCSAGSGSGRRARLTARNIS